jgi:hypothetical protein
MFRSTRQHVVTLISRATTTNRWSISSATSPIQRVVESSRMFSFGGDVTKRFISSSTRSMIVDADQRREQRRAYSSRSHYDEEEDYLYNSYQPRRPLWKYLLFGGAFMTLTSGSIFRRQSCARLIVSFSSWLAGAYLYEGQRPAKELLGAQNRSRSPIFAGFVLYFIVKKNDFGVVSFATTFVANREQLHGKAVNVVLDYWSKCVGFCALANQNSKYRYRERIVVRFALNLLSKQFFFPRNHRRSARYVYVLSSLNAVKLYVAYRQHVQSSVS